MNSRKVLPIDKRTSSEGRTIHVYQHKLRSQALEMCGCAIDDLSHSDLDLNSTSYQEYNHYSLILFFPHSNQSQPKNISTEQAALQSILRKLSFIGAIRILRESKGSLFFNIYD